MRHGSTPKTLYHNRYSTTLSRRQISTISARQKITLPSPAGTQSPITGARLDSTSTSPEIIASSDNQNEDSFLLRSRLIEEADSSTDRRVLRQECRQGWVKISSRQAEVQLTSCNLAITESAGVLFVLMLSQLQDV